MIAIGTLFHYCGRLCVGLCGLCQSDPEHGAELLDILESTKWYLWYGNVERALETLDVGYALASDPALHYSNQSKLIQHLTDMMTYVDNNAHLIPNYGEKHRYGETITTAFVESTVNEVVAKRLVKKQQSNTLLVLGENTQH